MSTESAAEEQIVVARGVDSGKSQRQRDLRPMPCFMQQDVEEQLARRHFPRLFTYFEGAYLVRHVFVELLHELLQFTPDRGAVVEERRRVIPGQTGGGVDALASQALQVSALDEEDVIDQLSDRAETIALLEGHFESPGVGESKVFTVVFDADLRVISTMSAPDPDLERNR